MNSAIIRLSKKIIITSKVIQPDLKQLWDSVNSYIEDINKRRLGQRLIWKGLIIRYRQDIQLEASEYGKEILESLRYRFPDNFTMNIHERELKVEMSRTEIFDFTEEFDSLELHYFLITEPLLLIDNIGDRLLLAKQTLQEPFLKSEFVQNTFTISLSDGYDIVEYLKLKSGN